jgi:outer membrane protein
MRPRSAAWVVALLVPSAVCFRAWCAEPAAGTLNLDLAKSVQMAVEVNTSILKARYDLDRSTNYVIGSASALLPSAGWQLSHNRSELGAPYMVGNQLITTSKSYSSSFSVSERVSAPAVLGLFESLANRGAVGQSARATRQQVIYTAKQKYLEVLRTQRLLVVNQEALDLSNRRLEKARAMLDVGSGVRSDVLRAQVEVGTNELNLISAANALRLAETDLKSFLRIPDEQAVALEDILETGETTYTLEGALADAMELRPDVKATAYGVRAGKTAVWRERGGWAPAFSYSWSRNYSAQSFPDRALDVWDKSLWRWGIGVSVNLFDGLSTFSSVRIAKAQLRSVEEDFNQVKRDAALEVKQTFYNVEEARQRVKVSSETVSLAEEELRLAEERYRLGGGTMLEQIDAQVVLSQARSSHVQALHDYLLSQAALVRAMGKD